MFLFRINPSHTLSALFGRLIINGASSVNGFLSIFDKVNYVSCFLFLFLFFFQESLFHNFMTLVFCLFFHRQFGTKCARCGRSIHANDWVRRARSSVYHLACFACDTCQRQLSTGEEFALKDGHVLCKLHYMESLECFSSDLSQEGKWSQF